MSGKFSLDLSRLVQKANGQVETAVRKVMLDAFKACISKSPVDTGRFRGAWVANLGAIGTAPADRLDKREVGDRTGKTIDAMSHEISAMRLNGDVTMYLTNSLPYSLALEYGSSQQAPAGMVRTTLAEITARYGA